MGGLFTRHPHSVGESYWRHLRHAFAFGGGMLLGGLACVIHGVFPFLFERTGSRALRALHARLVADPKRALPGEASAVQPAE